MTSVLFQPFHLHDLTLPNRIVLAPLTRSRAGTARLPNRLMAEYYSQRSSAGLLITEATTISEEANGWNETPGVYTDEMTEGWKHTTNAVHEKGGVIFLQLWHTGRASHSSFHNGKRSEEHTSELQSRQYLVCRLLLEKKKKHIKLTVLDIKIEAALLNIVVLETS